MPFPDLVHAGALAESEAAEGGEHADAAEDAGDGVDHDHDQTVPQDGAVEVLVAGESDQGAKGNADRVKDLGGGVHPDLGSEHPAPVRGEEDPEARGQYVAEKRRKIDVLRRK